MMQEVLLVSDVAHGPLAIIYMSISLQVFFQQSMASIRNCTMHLYMHVKVKTHNLF